MSAKKGVQQYFRDGQSYVNVFFLKIDAAGHSNIVATNTDDIVDKMFDVVENAVFSTIEENRKINDCEYAGFWGWQGDGGLCVIHDPNESKALITALQSAKSIIDHKLDSIKYTISQMRAKGHLSLRLAVHRGTFTSKGHDRFGSIHSKDLNFVAHLESATPRDSLTISKDVYERCPTELLQDFHALDFPFEGRDIYIYSKQDASMLQYDWMSKVQIGESERASILPRRYSEQDKGWIIRHACSEIIDLGTALNTCSQYLVTTQRPAFYRETVIGLLQRGVNYKCLALDPDSDIVQFHSDCRGENLADKIRSSLEKMTRFHNELSDVPGHFEVYLYTQMPHFATILVDRRTTGAMIYAPYMPSSPLRRIERADSPHLIATKRQMPGLFSQVDSYVDWLLRAPGTRQYI